MNINRSCLKEMFGIGWDGMVNRNNIIEYQLPRDLTKYSKLLSYLSSLNYNSNITHFLNLMV